MLIGNYSVLCKSPSMFRAGSGTSVEVVCRSNLGKSGRNRNVALRDQDTTARKLLAYPTGSYRGWMLPIKSGEIASINNTFVAVTPTGLAVGGISTSGSVSFAVTTNTPEGQLISSGTGSASFAFTVADALLTASLGGTGAASFAISVTPALLGALASGEGAATFSLATNAPIVYPLDDASPMRSGAASFAVSGGLTPYAIGSMAGSTADASILTSDTIANAVWQAFSDANNQAGSMGAKLNSAASGGVDYAALGAAVWANVNRTLTAGAAASPADIADAVLAHAQATPIRADMRMVKGQSINGAGSESDPWGPA